MLLLGLCLLAAFTDILDGYVSRKLNMITDLGIVLDPIADKIAMAVILFALVIFRGFHISLVILLMYRDLLIVIIGWFVVKKVEKPIMANKWGKINTTLITILVLLFILDFLNFFYTVVLFACYISILVSGISYARIAEKALFTSKTGKYIFRISLFIITAIVVFFAFQLDKYIYPGYQQETDSYNVLNLQKEGMGSVHLNKGEQLQ
jgi:CDP-diacylglycerol--glycerol-3-phosphate 3-phosphatidyltransferase